MLCRIGLTRDLAGYHVTVEIIYYFYNRNVIVWSSTLHFFITGGVTCEPEADGGSTTAAIVLPAMIQEDPRYRHWDGTVHVPIFLVLHIHTIVTIIVPTVFSCVALLIRVTQLQKNQVCM